MVGDEVGLVFWGCGVREEEELPVETFWEVDC